ncbi:hypothetical protein [Paraburkholderia sp. BL21I4N1]|uniref:hypothetical protein n=1 Tax=Paraburkholderia sp. BL21I4N1 TaxID=1938801 RepID=UPI000D471A82|nr:hypothetical protein [Paraburkholderia sp. BL21I4N1]PQV52163.1 hypothetical protein B0G83_104383 [Paraburkholderia sp. BL21I4N1]
MKVQSAGSQTNESTQMEVAQSAAPTARPNGAPPMFDTSAHRPSDCRADGARQAWLLPSTINPSFDVPVHYASKPYGSLHADVNNQGVYKDDKGTAYIKQRVRTYPVKYDKGNGTWRVYRPDNSTKYQYPVRTDRSGNWHTHGEVGLAGGWEGDPLASLNKAQHEIMDLRAQIQRLENQKQQLTQQWDQLQRGLIQAIGSPQTTPSLSERQSLMLEIHRLHGQRMSVLNELAALKSKVLGLQRSLGL